VRQSKSTLTALRVENERLQQELLSFHSQASHAATDQRILASLRQQNFDYSKFVDALGGIPILSVKPYHDTIRRIFALSFNPLAKRLLEIPRDLLLTDEFPFKSEVPVEDAALKAFWKDPINDFQNFRKQISYDLGLYGEVCLTKFVNPISRLARFGYVNPYSIEQVIIDPDNDRVPIGCKLNSAANTDEILTVILDGEHSEAELYSPETQALRQSFAITDPTTKIRVRRECFLFQLSPTHVSTHATWGPSLRGTSDLQSLHDWIVATDQVLTAMIERCDLLSRTLWTLQITGGNLNPGDPMNLDALKSKYGTPPSKWDVKVTNELMKWDRQDGNIGNSDMLQLFNAIQQYTIAGSGYPMTWFLGGLNSNRSTAEAEEVPAMSKLQSRQDTISRLFERLLRYQLIQLGIEPQFSMVKVPLRKRDVSQTAAAMKNLTDSLVVAQTNGWIDLAETRYLFRQFCQTELNTDLPEIDESRSNEPESGVPTLTSNVSPIGLFNPTESHIASA